VHLVGTALLCGHVLLSVAKPAQRVLEMGPLQWGMAAFSAVFATGLGALVWSKGISTIGVGRTASYLSWVPIFGVCFGAFFLSEPVTLWLLLGLLGVLVGSMLVVRS
jgi:drug/metabolite transporter (DMT)-like permease